MKGRLAPIAILIGLGFSLVGTSARADDAADAQKADAAKRFDRALQLFEDGDNSGALAEFKQIYATTPSPVVLFNIGLVYAAMGRPVDAVDALQSVVSSDALSAAQRDKAKSTLDDQQARIGRLMVTTTPDGARIDVDNVELARTPLSAPVRVSEGTHVIGAVATGYVPAHKEVVIAGNADATVHFDLVASQTKRMANLTVQSTLDAADVLVDGKKAGVTPLATSLTIAPGNHKIELRRPGYTTESHDIVLGEGATGDVSFSPQIDQNMLSRSGATVALDLSEPNVIVTVDDHQLGAYAGTLRLPRGPHRLKVETDGFLPFERTIDAGAPNSDVIAVDFVPTPETRAAHDRSVSFHRTWGWIGVGAGALIAGGGATWLVINKSAKDQTAKDLSTIESEALNTTGRCNWKSGKTYQNGSGQPLYSDGTLITADTCNGLVSSFQSKHDNAVSKDIVGYVGLGVGGAVAITGVVLLVTGEPADRFNRRRGNAASSWHFALTPGPGQIGSGLSVTF